MKNVLKAETFDFVVTNELKRALRSQNFLGLVLLEPRGTDPRAALEEMVPLVSDEVRETDMLATDGTMLWMALLDSDLQNATVVIERLAARLQHYQFKTPAEILVAVRCCPADGADLETLKRGAAASRSGLTDRPPGRHRQSH